MATDYDTYLDQDDVAFIYWAKISGIGHVFSHVAEPSPWGDLTLYSRSVASLADGAYYSVVTDVTSGTEPSAGEDTNTGTLRFLATWTEGGNGKRLRLYLGGSFDSTVTTLVSGTPVDVDVATTWDLMVFNESGSAITGLTIVVEQIERLGTGYTWSPTLVRQPEEVISSEADLDRGVTVSGSMNLEFWYDPEDESSAWVQLLTPTTKERWYVDRSTRYKPSATSVTFLSTTGMSTNEVIYAGLETLQVTTVASPATVTRGYLDSEPQWYGPDGGDPGTEMAGDAEFTSWPSTWRGRIVEIWRSCCSVNESGDRVPLSTSIEGDFDAQVFRGVLYDIEYTPGIAGTVRLTIQSIDQLLERAPLSRPREYRMGPEALGQGWIYLESDGPTLVEYDATNFAQAFSTTVPGAGVIDLTRSGGAFAAGGLFTAAEVIDGICDELAAVLDDTGDSGYYVEFEWQPVPASSAEDPPLRIVLLARINGVAISLPQPITLRLKSASQPQRSALWALGGEDDIVIQRDANHALAADLWAVAYLDEIPHYTLVSTNRRVYYHGGETGYNADTGDPPDGAYGTDDADGNDDWPGLKIGESEIARAQFRSSSALLGDAGARYALFQGPDVLNPRKGRGLIGTRPTTVQVPTDELDDGKHKLTVGLLFDNHDLFTTLVHMMASNGDSSTAGPWTGTTYNTLPRGMGAAIRPDCIDTAAFEQLQARRRPFASGWWVEPGATFRDLLAQIANFYGVAFLPKSTANGFSISVVDLLPAATNITSVATVDTDWINSLDFPPEAHRDEARIINQIEFKHDYNPLTEKYEAKDNRFQDSDSVRRYGASPPRVIEAFWVRGSLAEVIGGLFSAAAWTFAFFGRPSVWYRVSVLAWPAWKIWLGDVVTLTHPWIPNFGEAGGIGISGELMTCWGISQNTGERSGPAAELVLRATPDIETHPYVPSLGITSLDSGAVYNVDAHAFSRAADPTDISHWATAASESWKVRAYVPGIDTVESRTVSAIDVSGGQITLSSALTITPLASAVLTFDSYGNLTDTQETQLEHAFLGDATTRTLTNNSSSVRTADRWS